MRRFWLLLLRRRWLHYLCSTLRNLLFRLLLRLSLLLLLLATSCSRSGRTRSGRTRSGSGSRRSRSGSRSGRTRSSSTPSITASTGITCATGRSLFLTFGHSMVGSDAKSKINMKNCIIAFCTGHHMYCCCTTSNAYALRTAYFQENTRFKNRSQCVGVVSVCLYLYVWRFVWIVGFSCLRLSIVFDEFWLAE